MSFLLPCLEWFWIRWIILQLHAFIIGPSALIVAVEKGLLKVAHCLILAKADLEYVQPMQTASVDLIDAHLEPADVITGSLGYVSVTRPQSLQWVALIRCTTL